MWSGTRGEGLVERGRVDTAAELIEAKTLKEQRAKDISFSAHPPQPEDSPNPSCKCCQPLPVGELRCHLQDEEGAELCQ